MGNDEQTAEQIRALVAKGALGPGVLETDDCQKAYEELSGRGVVFTRSRRPAYGTEAVFRDDSGNWFSWSSAPRALRGARRDGADRRCGAGGGDQDVMIRFFVDLTRHRPARPRGAVGRPR
jgi:hypothetical protein